MASAGVLRPQEVVPPRGREIMGARIDELLSGSNCTRDGCCLRPVCEVRLWLGLVRLRLGLGQVRLRPRLGLGFGLGLAVRLWLRLGQGVGLGSA